jgi:DNA-binding response OmpR family regulator
MRALYVEDETELSELVAAALRRAGFAADRAGTLDDARVALAAVRYDVVILDLGLPDGDGSDLLRDLRQKRDPTPVLVLTARDAVEDRVAGLEAGADDYLLKPFHLDELVARLKALLRRPRGPLAMRLEAGNLVFDTVHREAEVASRPLPLSRRELAVLELLMRRPGRVVSKESIEEHVYGFDEEVGSNAVEVTVHRLRRKLAGAGAVVEIHTLRGLGYILTGEAR